MMKFKPTLFIQILFTLAVTATAFVVFTSLLPLVQLGLIEDMGTSKKAYIRLMRPVVLVFFGFLALLAWRAPNLLKEYPLTKIFKSLIQAHLGKLLLGIAGIYFLTFAGLGILRHQALETRAFDLGIFAQVLWTSLQGDFLYSSIKEGICLLGDHVSPFLIFLIPFYSMWQDPQILLILQSFAVACCIFPLAAIAKDRLGDNYLTFIFVLAFCFYFPTRSALHEDFHPEVMVEFLWLLAFFFTMREKWILFFIVTAIAVTAKENMLGISCALGAYLFFFKQKRMMGMVLAVISIGLFIFEMKWVIPHFSGKESLYQGFYDHLGGSGIFTTLFNPEVPEYIMKVFLPVIFLSFFHFPTLFLTFPILFQNLLSDNETLRSFGYHYTTGMTPFVFISAIYGFGVLRDKLNWFPKYQYWFAGLLLMVTILRAGPSEYFYYWSSANSLSEHRELIKEKLGEVPQEKSVLTHNNFIPQLVNRKYVYQFDYGNSRTKAEQAKDLSVDYVIFDQSFWERDTQALEFVLRDLIKAGYVPTFEENDFYILKR